MIRPFLTIISNKSLNSSFCSSDIPPDVPLSPGGPGGPLGPFSPRGPVKPIFPFSPCGP